MPLALHVNADSGLCKVLHRVSACALGAFWASVQVLQQMLFAFKSKVRPDHHSVFNMSWGLFVTCKLNIPEPFSP